MVAPREEDGPLLPQFYAGRSVFITGATGFLGKVLVERLLATCPGVARLFLLLRVKKGVAPAQRLQALKDSQVFDVVRQRCPAQLDKLEALEGDVSQPGLALPSGAAARLQDVSVVFHSAATLKFDEELSTAVDQNVRSIIGVMELCDALPNMQVLVHVSTAYSNAELSLVRERVYPAPAPLPAVLALAQHAPAALSAIAPQYILPKPNTYTFTKALAESAVERHGCAGYAVAIFRPTIVISAVKHPFPGWIENLNGPTGVVVGVGKGLLHVFRCRGASMADLLPVDIAVDSLIAVAWETAIDKPEEVRVYNCGTADNPTSFREFEETLRREIKRYPLDRALWYPSGALVESKWLHKLLAFSLQTAPLYAADVVARLLGVKTQISLRTAAHRLSAMSDALEFFSTREWHFETHRLRALQRRLSPRDRALYNLDVGAIQWSEHFTNFVIGTRRYLLRERDQDLDAARRHLHKMWLLHNVVKFASLLLFLRVLMVNRLVRSLVYGTLRLLLSLFNALYLRATKA